MLIRQLWQLKTVVFLQWCLICVVLLGDKSFMILSTGFKPVRRKTRRRPNRPSGTRLQSPPGPPSARSAGTAFPGRDCTGRKAYPHLEGQPLWTAGGHLRAGVILIKNFFFFVRVLMSHQGILKWEVSLYHWPPVRVVWNQLYDYWLFWFLFTKQTNPNQSNRRSMVQWYFPV